MAHGLVEDFNLLFSYEKECSGARSSSPSGYRDFHTDNSTIELFTDTTSISDRSIYGTVFNGILLPLPFAMTHLKLSALSKCASLAKIACVIFDTVIDLAIFRLLSVCSSNGTPGIASDFTGRWMVATAGIVWPAIGMMLTLRDIADAAKSETLERLRHLRLGKQSKIPRGTTDEHPVVSNSKLSAG